MKQFTLRIITENDAFYYAGEVSRILRNIADRLEEESNQGDDLTDAVRDDFGNLVGNWQWEREE